jgi:GcrA cell cycle regulator
MPAAPDTNVWTQFPELVDRLKELFQGNSSSVIAKLLGHGMTRNAVIGKATRMGLKRPKRPNASATVTKVERKKERVRISEFHPVTPYIEELDMTPAVDDTAIPIEQRKTVLTIGMHDCRFPVGDPADPAFFFCGAPQQEGRPYCKHHADRCFTKAPPRVGAYIPRAAILK